MFASLDVLSMVFAILNSISIYWLCINRNIFKEPEKGKNVLGTKSEWIRVIYHVMFLYLISFYLFSNQEKFMKN